MSSTEEQDEDEILKRGVPAGWLLSSTLHHVSVAGAESATWSQACPPSGLILPKRQGPGCITGQVSKMLYPHQLFPFLSERSVTQKIFSRLFMLPADLKHSPRPLFAALHRGLWGSSTGQHTAGHSSMRHRPLPARYPETWSQV